MNHPAVSTFQSRPIVSLLRTQGHRFIPLSPSNFSHEHIVRKKERNKSCAKSRFDSHSKRRSKFIQPSLLITTLTHYHQNSFIHDPKHPRRKTKCPTLAHDCNPIKPKRSKELCLVNSSWRICLEILPRILRVCGGSLPAALTRESSCEVAPVSPS